MGDHRIKYILDGHTPVPCDDLLDWGKWFGTADRHVAVTDLDPELRVSTVFLGLDHSFSVDAEPILFETMVFGKKKSYRIAGRRREYREDLGQWRYCTWDEAEAGHNRTVAHWTARLEAMRKKVLVELPKKKRRR